jgi:hypothetical protein
VPEIGFVVAPRQKRFWLEIIDAIREELEAAGTATSVWRDGFPPPAR